MEEAWEMEKHPAVYRTHPSLQSGSDSCSQYTDVCGQRSVFLAASSRTVWDASVPRVGVWCVDVHVLVRWSLLFQWTWAG